MSAQLFHLLASTEVAQRYVDGKLTGSQDEAIETAVAEDNARRYYDGKAAQRDSSVAGLIALERVAPLAVPGDEGHGRGEPSAAVIGWRDAGHPSPLAPP